MCACFVVVILHFICLFYHFSLLKEAEPLNVDSIKEASEANNTKNNIVGFSGGSGTHRLGLSDQTSLEDRQLLGRYGVWLLVGLCVPTKETPSEILGRLLSMLFHWFHSTAYSYDGEKILMGIFSIKFSPFFQTVIKEK